MYLEEQERLGDKILVDRVTGLGCRTVGRFGMRSKTMYTWQENG